MQRIILIDIDGVLNSNKYILKMGDAFDDPTFQIDPEAVKLLNILYQATNASLVVTSTWRKPFLGHLDKLQDYLASYNIQAPVIGMTDDLAFGSSSRGAEIKKWISDNPDVRFFVIFDDEKIVEFPDNLVQTNSDDGLQKHQCLKALDLIGPILCSCGCRACYAGPFLDYRSGNKMENGCCHCILDIFKALE